MPSELNPGRLELGVLVEGMQRLVTTVAGLLEAAERRGHVAAVVLVDPHTAGAQRPCGAVRLGQVGGPHRRSEAVGRVVGDRHRFLGAVEADHREHRAKDFLLSETAHLGDALEPPLCTR